MIIRFENLKKSLAETIYPVYLIEGEDAFFRERAVDSIKQAALKEPDFNYTRFSGADVKAEPDKLLMDLRSFPFMSVPPPADAHRENRQNADKSDTAYQAACHDSRNRSAAH